MLCNGWISRRGEIMKIHVLRYRKSAYVAPKEFKALRRLQAVGEGTRSRETRLTG